MISGIPELIERIRTVGQEVAAQLEIADDLDQRLNSLDEIQNLKGTYFTGLAQTPQNDRINYLNKIEQTLDEIKAKKAQDLLAEEDYDALARMLTLATILWEIDTAEPDPFEEFLMGEALINMITEVIEVPLQEDSEESQPTSSIKKVFLAIRKAMQGKSD